MSIREGGGVIEIRERGGELKTKLVYIPNQ
jgi:hypothetical protein